ncbi:unnamed protein product [Bursaphelenchus xylophilus]|uniref:(pine wood nematode) hypothetical protein n=1 Tax=Bursaphelenchus xylophilus TaxID=6326 RepID=A0A1I7SE14_BURXY|nr:unnamed protein product [Bursaphelenchus xylophilus]CAG9113177.1 unnamed protein product [Bursaphelenchus xylophilus]
MNFTANVLQKGGRARPLKPRKVYYSEVIPLAGKNEVTVKRQKVAGSSCTQELQVLFSCLKKWEFDNLPCQGFHESYMRCIDESERQAAINTEAIKKGTLGDDSGGPTLTAAQLNNLMKIYPQPDLGKRPYRLMQRLPTYSYADDIFNRKNKPGKKS